MIPEYKYRVKDYSILTPLFRDKLVRPFMRFVPWSLPANIITVVSNSFMFIALGLAFNHAPDNKLDFVLIPFLIFLYLFGDHIDGMQAKRTQTSSALGEFFDHYLDIFGTGILLEIVFLIYGITNPYLFAFVLFTAYAAHAAVFYEQFSTTWLVFEKIGSFETVFLIIILILAGLIDPVFRFFTNELVSGYTILELILIASSVGTLGTLLKCIKRADISGYRFYLFCLLLAVVSVATSTMFSVAGMFFIVTLYSGLYIGNLQRGHLVDTKERFPDYVVPALLAANAFFQLVSVELLLCFFAVYLSLRTLWIIRSTISTLRQFWVWRNPGVKEA